jgi:hypothetical protein
MRSALLLDPEKFAVLLDNIQKANGDKYGQVALLKMTYDQYQAFQIDGSKDQIVKLPQATDPEILKLTEEIQTLLGDASITPDRIVSAD